MPRRLATYEWYASGTVWLSAVAGLSLGLAIIGGGPRRFSSPGFAVARQAPGGYLFWGGALLLFGLVMLTGILMGWEARVITAGFIGQAAWYLFFAVSLAITANRNPDVAFTGVCAYGALAVLCILGWACGQGLSRG